MHHLLPQFRRPKHRRWSLPCLCLLLFLASACAQDPDTLTIAAAASLRDAFTVLGPIYTRQTGQPVRFSFAASGLLRSQILRGAPYDLFASASQTELQTLQQRGQLRGKPAIFASNALVLAKADKALTCDWQSVRRHRLAIGNPATVPAGVYAREALQKLGHWQALQPSLVLTDNVRQAVEYLRSDAVDYAVVYSSDVRAFRSDLHVCQTFAPGLHRPIRLPAAVLAASPPGRKAEAWLRFLTSAQAQSVLRAHGFAAP